MIKKDTQGAPSNVERVDNEGRRKFLRTGAAVAAVAALGSLPTEAGSQQQQQGAKDALDRILRGRDAAKNPPAPQYPQPQPGGPPQGNPAQIAPMRVPAGEGTLYGFNSQAVDLDTNRFPLKNAREAYEEMSALLKSTDDIKDFTRIYYENMASLSGPLAAKKANFEKVIDKITDMEATAQAEVIARLVRDMKCVNETGSKQALALTGVRALFNVFPHAKNIQVKFTRRPMIGNGSNAPDLEIDANNIEPDRNTVRNFLKVHTVTKHKDNNITAYANDPSAVDVMFANNSRQRGAGQGISG